MERSLLAFHSPMNENRRLQKALSLRIRRLCYLIFLFLIFAIVANPFQALALHLVSGGLIELNTTKTIEADCTFTAVLWWISTCGLSAVLLIRYDRKLRRFWTVAGVWSFATIFSDTFVSGIFPSFSVPFFLNSANDLIGGFITGFIISKIFIGYHPWARFVALSRRKRKKLTESVESSKTSIAFDLAGLMTGWTGLSLIPLYWIWLVLGLIPALISWYKILQILDALRTLRQNGYSFAWLFLHSKVAFLPLAVFGGYIPLLLLIRAAETAAFTYRRRTCLQLFYLSTCLFLTLTTVLIYLRPDRIISVSFLGNDLLFGTITLGFWFGSRNRKERVLTGEALRVNRFYFQIARLIRLAPQKFYLWVLLRAAHRPNTFLLSLIRAHGEKVNKKPLFKLALSSLQLTLFLDVPLLWYYHIPYADLEHKLVECAFLIISLLFGGIVYHLVFKLFSKPTNLVNTVVIYAVPQLIFMPLISAFSVVALDYHYVFVQGLHAEHLSIFSAFHHIISLQLKPTPGGNLTFFITYVEGFLVAIIQIMFLEFYWQFYGTDRRGSYTIGILAGFLNGLVLVFMVSPARDLAYFYLL